MPRLWSTSKLVTPLTMVCETNAQERQVEHSVGNAERERAYCKAKESTQTTEVDFAVIETTRTNSPIHFVELFSSSGDTPPVTAHQTITNRHILLLLMYLDARLPRPPEQKVIHGCAPRS